MSNPIVEKLYEERNTLWEQMKELNDREISENRSLDSAEKGILKSPDYRDSLENLNLEYGVDSLLWNPESKIWQTNPATKLSPPASLQDPFKDESKFPKHDISKEDGTIIRGVPRPNRLRTVVGMFYKERDNNLKEISKLRDMIVRRDKELRDYHRHKVSLKKQRILLSACYNLHNYK